MSKTLNKVQLIGRLGADPQMRYTPSGVPVTTFSIATNRQWQDREGVLREETDWHNVVAWDKLAQTCADYLTKGRLVYIEGRLQTRSWEQDGQTRYKTEIIAQDMLMLEPKTTGSGNGAYPIEEPEPAVESRSRKATPASEPASVNVRAERSGRPAKSAVMDADDDPDDLPF